MQTLAVVYFLDIALPAAGFYRNRSRAKSLRLVSFITPAAFRPAGLTVRHHVGNIVYSHGGNGFSDQPTRRKRRQYRFIYSAAAFERGMDAGVFCSTRSRRGAGHTFGYAPMRRLAGSTPKQRKPYLRISVAALSAMAAICGLLKRRHMVDQLKSLPFAQGGF